MRFKTQLSNIVTFTKLTASLSSLGKICWLRLEDNLVRFTIIPDQGTQVWAQLPVDAIFDESTYTLASNTGSINLEVPVGALHRALRSAVNGASGTLTTSAQLRLTKKGNVPLLALTVLASSWTTGKNAIGVEDSSGIGTGTGTGTGSGPRERETLISQEIPVKVLHEDAVQGLHEPRCRDPDVHIILPSLAQLKTVSDRFTRLATIDSKSTTNTTAATNTGMGMGAGTGNNAPNNPTAPSPKLELSANMHGSLKLAIGTDSLRIASVWSDLVNPALDPAQLSSQTDVEQLPSERMRAMPADDPTATGPGTAAEGGETGWAKVRIDARDWGRVLSVGRLSPRVVACFINETALVLYVYLPGSWNGEDSCLTYYINSYAT